MLEVDSNGVSKSKKNFLIEFVNNGLNDISRDEEYGSIFKNSNSNDHRQGLKFSSSSSYSFVDGIKFEKQLPETDDAITEKQKLEGTVNLFECVRHISVQLTFGLNELHNYHNLYEIDGNYFLNTCCKADNVMISNAKYEAIKPILNLHDKFLRDNFERKEEVRKNLVLLKLVSFLCPLLISLKKRFRIPDLNNLLPMMSGEDVQTERELPPLMLSTDFKSTLFKDLLPDLNNYYFNLHGGIQFELETIPIDRKNSK